MLWQIFQKIEPKLVRFYKKLSEPPIPNLKGDREIEYSWIAANMPEGPGEALDFGSSSSWLELLAARKGFKVTAIDLEPVNWHFKHPSFTFVQGDIFKLNLPPEKFSLVINCSTVEHVGLASRYGIKENRPDGDIEAMQLLKTLLKPDGIMLLTIPVGRDKVFAPLHRVYGKERLPKLLSGWKVIKKEYWTKNDLNEWVLEEESIVLNKEPVEHCYGLGLFVLRKGE